MKFPVDLLAHVSMAELEQSAHNYTNNLLYSNPDSSEHLTLSDSTKVSINISSVGHVPLYGFSDKPTVLALFSPTDTLTAVALYLLDRWWTVEDILKTGDLARDGPVKVESVGERIVLYILNRVIYRAKEMKSEEELPFLCHGENDYAKIIWNNGEAIGFYSVKPTESLSKPFSTRKYELPVMDSIVVRKCHRGKGFGLQMLEDFVLSFKENCLGLRYPITKAMYKVCEKYLCKYPEDTEVLWEVQSVGAPNQRSNIFRKIQTMNLGAVSKNLSFMEESNGITVTETNVVTDTQINEAETVKCTVEIMEEVTVLTPSKARSRSSGSKQKKTGDNITEDKSEKVIRIEDIEAEIPEEPGSEQQKTEVSHVSEVVQAEGILDVASKEKREDEVESVLEGAKSTVTVLASQDQVDAEGTSAPIVEEPQEKDEGTQYVSNSPCKLHLMVENVAEIAEAEEVCQEEDAVSEDVLASYNKAETLDKVEETAQVVVSNKESEERLSQDNTSVSGDVTSEREARKPGKAIKNVPSQVPRLRSQRRSTSQESLTEDDRRVLRGRTVVNSPMLQQMSHRHSQKVCENLAEEASRAEAAEESTVTQLEEEEIATEKVNLVAADELTDADSQPALTNEETERHEEPGTKYSVRERPDAEGTALTKTKEDEKVAETAVIQEAAEGIDEEIEDPPFVALGGRNNKEIMPDSDEAVKPAAEVPQKMVPDIQTATVILVNLKTSCHQFSPKEAETPAAAEESSAPEEEEMEKDVSSSVRDEQTLEPETLEAETEDLEDSSEKEKEEVASVVEAEFEEEDIPVIETRLLRSSSKKTVGVKSNSLSRSKQQQEEAAAEEQRPEPEKLLVETVEGGQQESITRQSTEAETQELEDHPSEKEKDKIASVDEAETEEEKVLVIEARGGGSGRKTVKASRKSTNKTEQLQENIGDETIPEKEVDIAEMEGDTEAVETMEDSPVGNNAEKNLSPAEIEEPMTTDEEKTPLVEGRVLRSGTKTPGKKTKSSRSHEEEREEKEGTTRSLRRGRISSSATPKAKSRTRKEIREEEQKVAEEEVAGQEEALAKTEKEEEGKIEEEAASKKEDFLEPDVEAEEVKAVAKEAVLDTSEKSEVILEAVADAEVEASVKEFSEQQKPVEMYEDMEALPVVETRALRSGGKTVKASQKARSMERKKQQGYEQDERSAEKSTDEDEPPAAADNEEESDPPPAKLTSHEKETTPPAEEQQSKEMTPQLSDLQRVTVVLVDLKKTPNKVQDVEVEMKNNAEKEDEQREQRDEETKIDERDPGKTEQGLILVQEDVLGEKVEETVTTQTAEEGCAEETNRVGADEENGSSVINTRAETSAGEETVEAIPKRRSENSSVEDVHQEEAADSKNNEEEAAVQARLMRKRKTVTVTQRHTAKRRCEQLQEEEEPQAGEESTEDEKVEAEELPLLEQQMADQEKGGRFQGEDVTVQVENIEPEMGIEKENTVPEAEITEERHEEETMTEREKNTEQDVEMEKVKAVDSLTEEETIEEQCAASETLLDEQVEMFVGENSEEMPSADDGNVTNEEETAFVKTRVLRSGRKTAKSQTTKSQQEQNEQEEAPVEMSADPDILPAETRVLRRGRKSAPVPPRRQSKRARTRRRIDEEALPAADTEGEDEQESPVEDGEKETTSVVEIEKDAEDEEVKSVTGGEEEHMDASAEGAVILGKEDSNKGVADAVEISVAEKEDGEDAETPESTTAITDEEAEGEDASVVAEQESPDATMEIPTNKTLRRSRRHKDQAEISLEEEETMQLILSTDDSPENGEELKEQAETEETSFTETEADPAAGESQNVETPDMIDEVVEEPAVEEGVRGDQASPKENLLESEEDESLGASIDGSRSLRSSGKKDNNQAEEIKPPNRRSMRNRQRIDYREKNDEVVEDETGAAADKDEESEEESDEPKDNGETDWSENEQKRKLEDGNEEENLEINVEAESTSEKDGTLNVVLDTQEEGGPAEMAQEDEEGGHSMSEEEEEEPIVIGKRVLRGRSIPSVIITPHSKSRRRTAALQRADEEKTPGSAERRLRKRKILEYAQ